MRHFKLLRQTPGYRLKLRTVSVHRFQLLFISESHFQIVPFKKPSVCCWETVRWSRIYGMLSRRGSKLSYSAFFFLELLLFALKEAFSVPFPLFFFSSFGALLLFLSGAAFFGVFFADSLLRRVEFLKIMRTCLENCAIPSILESFKLCWKLLAL